MSVKRTDTVGLLQIVMRVDLKITGCYKDLCLIWDSCWRYDDSPWGTQSSGGFPGCINDTSCVLHAYGTIYITGANIRYLSCEKGVWVKRTAIAGCQYNRASSALPWSYTDAITTKP